MRAVLTTAILVTGCTVADPSYLAGDTAGGTAGNPAEGKGVGETEGRADDEADSSATSSSMFDGTDTGASDDALTGSEDDRTTDGGAPSTTGASESSGDEGTTSEIIAGCGNGMVGPGEFCFVSGPTLVDDEVLDLAVGQLDADAFVDVVVGQHDAVRILTGGGDGSFPLFSTLTSVDGEYLGVAAVDLDGDASDDVVVARVNDDAVLQYISQGDGAFDPPHHLAVSEKPRALAIADLGGDGMDDVVTSQGGGGGTFSYFASIGDGTLAQPIDVPAGAEPDAIAAAWLDAGPTVDLAFALLGGKGISVVLNNGDGTFASAVQYPLGFKCSAVIAADLDGQNGIDLAAATVEGGDAITVLLDDGMGSASFESQTAIAVGDDPSDLVAADMDSDGDLDLVVVTSGDDSLWFIENEGDGTLAPAVLVTAALVLDEPVALAVADFNEDTVPDLAIGGRHGVAFVMSDP